MLTVIVQFPILHRLSSVQLEFVKFQFLTRHAYVRYFYNNRRKLREQKLWRFFFRNRTLQCMLPHYTYIIFRRLIWLQLFIIWIIFVLMINIYSYTHLQATWLVTGGSFNEINFIYNHYYYYSRFSIAKNMWSSRSSSQSSSHTHTTQRKDRHWKLHVDMLLLTVNFVVS